MKHIFVCSGYWKKMVSLCWAIKAFNIILLGFLHHSMVSELLHFVTIGLKGKRHHFLLVFIRSKYLRTKFSQNTKQVGIVWGRMCHQTQHQGRENRKRREHGNRKLPLPGICSVFLSSWRVQNVGTADTARSAMKTEALQPRSFLRKPRPHADS